MLEKPKERKVSIVRDPSETFLIDSDQMLNFRSLSNNHQRNIKKADEIGLTLKCNGDMAALN